MFKAKEPEEYLYRCLMQCDIIFLHPRNNEAEKMPDLSMAERMSMGYEGKLFPHPMRFKPADSLKNRAADVLKTSRPIAWYFLEEREKMVSRPKIDPRGFPMSRQREMRPTYTKIKFELIENPTESERIRAIPLKLRDIDYQDAHEHDDDPRITEAM